jgi:hypothetical protein
MGNPRESGLHATSRHHRSVLLIRRSHVRVVPGALAQGTSGCAAILLAMEAPAGSPDWLGGQGEYWEPNVWILHTGVNGST